MRFSSIIYAFAAWTSLASANLAEPSPEEHELETRGLAKIYRKCTGAKQVALTFDDGPYLWDGELQDLLAKYNAKATFFVNVNNWECAYHDKRIKRSRELFKAGHEFGSHTYSHPHLKSLSSDKVHHELYRAELWMQRVLGVHPRLMRPPFGEYNDNVRKIVGQRNQSMIMWDFDSGDGDGPAVARSKGRYKSLVDRKVKNVLALNHDSEKTTVTEVIPYALDILSKAGYSFVTVSQCLNIEPYQWRKSFGVKDSSWKCN